MSYDKTAVISDIHANYEALQSVLRHARTQGAAGLWFLGDAVGYGPEPHRCIKLLRESVSSRDAWVLGNHDEAMRHPPNGMEPTPPPRTHREDPLHSHLNPISEYIGNSPDVLEAFRINYEILDAYPDHRSYLLTHHTTARPAPGFFLVHGGIRSGTPTTTYTVDRVSVREEFQVARYRITPQTLRRLRQEDLPAALLKALESIVDHRITGQDHIMEFLHTILEDRTVDAYRDKILQLAEVTYKTRHPDPQPRIFLHGHTHKPTCFKGLYPGPTGAALPPAGGTGFVRHPMPEGEVFELDHRYAWFLNPGSAGQPRDSDPRASYLLLDPGQRTAQLHRVPYNTGATQRQMETLHMPRNLIQRLSRGR